MKASARLILAFALGLAFVGSVAACDRDASEEEQENHAIQAVRVEPVQNGPFIVTQNHLGTVLPTTRVRLVARVPGTVSALGPDEGTATTRGTELVSIAAPDLAARQRRVASERRRAERERDFVCAQLETDQALGASGDLPTIQVEQTEKGCNVATQAVHAARAAEQEVAAQRSNAVEQAPFGGRVLSYLVDVGQTVMPGTPLAEFAGTQLELQLRVIADDLPQLSVGTDVLLPHGQRGTIRDIGQRADGPGRLYEVLVDIPEDAALRIGESVLAAVVTDSISNATSVPDTAVRTDASGTYVLMEEAGTLERVEVNVLLSTAGRTAVEPPLPDDARVVTIAPENIDESTPVFAVMP